MRIQRRLTLLYVALVIGGLFLGHWWFALRAPAPAVGQLAEPRADPDVRRPDAVFLIVVDTLRADRLSCYGYQAHCTPNLDRLAAAGVRFSRAQSSASWTRPSVAAIITSRYPTQMGIVEEPAPLGATFAWREVREQRRGGVPPGTRTLAEILHEAGFLTAAFVDQPGLNGRRSYRRGFNDWYYPVGPDEIRRYESDDSGQQRWVHARYADRCDRALIRELARWLGRNNGEKLFVWLHLLTPHRPYTPAPEYAQPTSPGTPRSSSVRYDAEVRAADDMVGQALDAIEQHVGMNRSLIVFTSDHGEEFGEHGMWEHGHSLHWEVLDVPLIIRSPTLPAGQVVPQRAQGVDILPTILDIIGRAALAPADVEGVTLVPMITAGSLPPPAYAEAMLYGSTERSLIDGPYKLMYDQQGDRYKLYDLNADPAETTDLAARLPQRVEMMRRRLNERYGRLERDYQAWNQEQPTREREEDRLNDLEALRALGYITDD